MKGYDKYSTDVMDFHLHHPTTRIYGWRLRGMDNNHIFVCIIDGFKTTKCE